MGHVTLTAPVSGLSDIPRLAPDMFYRHTKFGDSRFRRSADMTAGVKIENGSCNLDHVPLGVVCHPNDRMCAKFDDSSFSRSRDITGAYKFKVGHATLTTPLLKTTVCWDLL